jgi:hypothetical protein
MPPVVIAAGIAAAGTVGGAYLASRSSNKATDASSKANAEALAYTKEQEAGRRAEYEKATQAYQRQWEAWNAQRMALLQRYGVDVSGMQAPQTSLTMPPNAQSLMGGGRIDPRTANAVGVAAQGGQTVADILGRGADPSQWNDWKQYGLPS